ncbi:hypothetical protein Athai_00350 [Actinocatenispora thailandica]|uniref:Uncharacterized protein n=1 Tax=Actinocatenispora thailandica TaxID=227318 RepID=A0A7R7DIZ3_9ACTN|nr:hypothetical protein [Actinocatenispora thailandica]BCJ32532.1 hypothetical protein Athai_00350 [Actinocatenispora thailandica]
MDRPPALGDVVCLPPWLPDRPYRVLEVRDPAIPGHVWVCGYAIDEVPRVERSYLVPVPRLRLLPDPIWGSNTTGAGEAPWSR